MNKISFTGLFRRARRASRRAVLSLRRGRRRFQFDAIQGLETRQLLAASFVTTVSYSATLPGQVTDYTAPLSLTKFNPALGTLDKVDLTFLAQGATEGTIMNNGGAAATFSIGLASTLSLVDGTTTLVAPTLNESQNYTNLAAGATALFGPFSPTASDPATFTSGPVFNDFEGGPGNIALSVQTNTIETTNGGGGNFNRDLNTTAGGTATVTYTYTVTPVSISGNVYDDVKGTGSLVPGDLPIPGTKLSLLDSTGTIVATTATAADGTYSFTTTDSGGPLLAGTYDVVEAQPAGFLQGTNTVGTVNGVTTGTLTAVPDVIAAIALTAGQDSIHNNFGEVLPVGLSGVVYDDVRDVGALAPGALPIPGVTLTLFNSAGVEVATTTTNSLGLYAFEATATGGPLPPGTYTIFETQPAGFLQGSNTVGAVNGVQVGALTAIDTIGLIKLNSGQQTFGNNFGEILPVVTIPVGLSGTVYDDVNRTGSLSPGDLPIGGVRLNLFNSTGVEVATTTTDVFGNYAFTTSTSGTPLPPGSYTLAEVQPAGFLQGMNTVGTVDGVTTGIQPAQDVFTAIALTSGQVSIHNNFGELTPPPPPPPTICPVSVTNVQRFGVHLQPTLIVITFDQPLVPSTAQDVANYRLSGPNDSKNPTTIPIESATYNPATNMVTLRLGERLDVHHPYLLTITGLVDSTGGLLSGNNGQPGSPYVAIVDRSSLAGFTDIYGNFIPIDHGKLYPAANASGYQLKRFVPPANLGSFAGTNQATYLTATAGQPETPPILIHHGKKVPALRHR